LGPYVLVLELIPKIKIASLNLVFGVINRVSDHEFLTMKYSSETLIDLRIN